MNIVGRRKVAVSRDEVTGPRRILVRNDVLAVSSEKVTLTSKVVVNSKVP